MPPFCATAPGVPMTTHRAGDFGPYCIGARPSVFGGNSDAWGRFCTILGARRHSWRYPLDGAAGRCRARSVAPGNSVRTAARTSPLGACESSSVTSAEMVASSLLGHPCPMRSLSAGGLSRRSMAE